MAADQDFGSTTIVGGFSYARVAEGGLLTASDTTMVSAPGSGFKIRIIALHVTEVGGTAGAVQIKNGSGGTVFHTIGVGANATSNIPPLNAGWIDLGENKALALRAVTSASIWVLLVYSVVSTG